jgi:hypothetical protein
MLETFHSQAAWDEHVRHTYVIEGHTIFEDLLREPSQLRLVDQK